MSLESMWYWLLLLTRVVQRAVDSLDVFLSLFLTLVSMVHVTVIITACRYAFWTTCLAIFFFACKGSRSTVGSYWTFWVNGNKLISLNFLRLLFNVPNIYWQFQQSKGKVQGGKCCLFKTRHLMIFFCMWPCFSCIQKPKCNVSLNKKCHLSARLSHLSTQTPTILFSNAHRQTTIPFFPQS
jgi:hypothetical protein